MKTQYFSTFIILIFFCTMVSADIQQNHLPQYLGSTLYVGGTGPNNYTKIQHAIDNATNGDTIFVYDDSSPYNEHLTIKQSITLLGENKETTTIQNNDEGHIILIKVENVSIKNFCIQTTDIYNGYSGIHIRANTTTITNNILLNNDCGIHIYYNSSNHITNNQFINNDRGLYLNHGNNIIHNNSFFNDGIYINSFDNSIENNTVNNKPLLYLYNHHDQILNDEYGQIICANCENITIHNHHITKTDTAIILYYCTNSTISSNQIFDCRIGIQLTNSNNNTIIYNNLYQNSCIGINLYNSHNNNIHHNWCKKHLLGRYTYHGLYVTGSNNNTITHNTIEQNNIGMECSGSDDNNISYNNIHDNTWDGIILGSSSTNNNLNNNMINRNQQGIKLLNIPFNSITNNNFYDNDNDIYIETIQYYKLRLRQIPRLRGNYWGEPRILPKPNQGKFTFIFNDAPWGGGITIKWLYIDWFPAQEPYQID